MKVNLAKACWSFYDITYKDGGYWVSYVDLKGIRNNCTVISLMLGFDDFCKNKEDKCKTCKETDIDIERLKIKPDKMKDFIYYYIKQLWLVGR